MADNVLGTLFGDIADAIRTKTGDTAAMKPMDFPMKISEIEVGSGEGDGGSSVGDWETIVEEQTAAATYDTATLSNVMVLPSTKNFNLQYGGLHFYRVWFDGVAYLCAPYNFSYTLSEEVFGVTNVDNTIIGNPTLLKGGMMTEMTCDYPYSLSEPFAILCVNDMNANIAVGDTKSHTVRVDRIARGAVTAS